jgi:integrase
VETAEMQQQALNTTIAQNRMSKEAFKGKLVEFAFHLKKKGKAETTINGQCGSLRTLYNLGCDFLDAENVKGIISSQTWSNGMKKNVVNAYKNYVAFLGLRAPEMPEYKDQRKLPFIPNESELDMLIACAGDKLQPFLQTLKETFARTGEIASLKWKDADLERHLITINDPEKHSNPRQAEISEKLVKMLQRVPKNGDLVFARDREEKVMRVSKRMRQLFHWTRTRLAYRTQNPRIKEIHLHTFRHWGATMMYHSTKDIMTVMQALGHRSITSTQIYVQLLKTGNKDEFIFKTATTLEEAQSLIETGFEYVTDMKIGETTYKMFRKRKPWKPN